MTIFRVGIDYELAGIQEYLNDAKASIRRFEELLQNAEGFTSRDLRPAARLLAEVADSATAEALRSAVGKVRG